MESSDRDERVSWRAATIIMVAATIFTLASRVLGIDPFTWVFDIFIVYLTTVVLVGGLVARRLRSSGTHESVMVGGSTPESKGA